MKEKAEEQTKDWLADELLSRYKNIQPAPEGFTTRLMARINPENRLHPQVNAPILNPKKKMVAGLIFASLFAAGMTIGQELSPHLGRISESLQAALTMDYTILFTTIAFAATLLLGANEWLGKHFLKRK